MAIIIFLLYLLVAVLVWTPLITKFIDGKPFKQLLKETLTFDSPRIATCVFLTTIIPYIVSIIIAIQVGRSEWDKPCNQVTYDYTVYGTSSSPSIHAIDENGEEVAVGDIGRKTVIVLLPDSTDQRPRFAQHSATTLVYGKYFFWMATPSEYQDTLFIGSERFSQLNKRLQKRAITLPKDKSSSK